MSQSCKQVGISQLRWKTGLIWVVVTPVVVPAALLALLWLLESMWLIVIASPEAVAGYHFGSDTMVGHGGWKYSSAGAYETFGLLGGALLLVAVAVVLYGAYHHKAVVASAGLATILGIILFDLSWLL